MQLGDLLEWQSKRWLAVLHDRQTRMMTLLSEDGTRISVSPKLDESRRSGCVRLCNPAQDWPCIMHKQKQRLGKLLAIQRSPTLGAAVHNLRSFTDWILPDPVREGGGPIFFSPELDLAVGETLLALFERGTSKIIVPTSYSTLGERAAKAAAKPKVPRTSFDRLLDDDEDFDEGGDA